MLMGLVLMVGLARTLEPADFGSVAVAFSIALIGGLFTTLNIGAGAVRFMTEYLDRRDTASAAAYLSCSNSLVIKSALVIWPVLGVVTLFGNIWDWFPAIPFHIVLGAATAPLFGWVRVGAANVAAIGRVARAFTPNTLIRPLLMLSGVLIAYSLSGGLDDTIVLSVYFFTALAVCAIQYPIFRKHLPNVPVPPNAVEKHQRRQWIRVGIHLLIPTLFLDLSVDTIIIVSSLVLDSKQTATLAIVLRIQAVILFGVTSINMVVGPRVSRAHYSGDAKSVNQLLQIAGHLKLWPSITILGLLTFSGESVLGMFGSEYQSNLLPLLVLSVNPIIMSIAGPVVLLTTILGLQREANRVFQLAILLLLLLVPLLGHLYGVAGVAVAVVMVWALWHFLLYSIIRKHSNYCILQPRFRIREKQQEAA